MEYSSAQTAVIAASLAIALMLAPRSPWSIQRVAAVRSPWTGCVALGAAAMLALLLIEGSAALAMPQRWHSLWLVAAVFSCAALPSALPLSMPRNGPLLLALAAGMALSLLRLPGHDSLGSRALLAVVGALLAWRAATSAERLPHATLLVLGAGMASMAVTLVAAGSLKAGIVASALAIACGAVAAVALRAPHFTPGGGFAASAALLLAALGWYGMAYHREGPVGHIGWPLIAFSSVLLTALPRGVLESAGRRPVVWVATTAACAVAVATAALAARAAAAAASGDYLAKSGMNLY